MSDRGQSLLVNVLLLAAVFALAAVSAASRVYGISFHPVISESMKPAIKMGDLIVLDGDVPTGDLQVGDVIAFLPEGPETPITHRLVEIVDSDDGPRFRTKGDAVAHPDSWLLTPEQVLGRVEFRLPLLGFAAAFLQSRHGFLACIVLPSLTLFLLELKDTLSDGPRRGVRFGAGSRHDRTPAFICLVGCLVLTAGLCSFVAQNLQTRDLASLRPDIEERAEPPAAFERKLNNNGPIPLIVCLASDDPGVIFSSSYLMLGPGEQARVEIEGGSGASMITSAALPPVLPARLFYRILTWNHRWAPIVAPIIPGVSLGLLGFAALGGFSSGKDARRERTRQLRRMGYI